LSAPKTERALGIDVGGTKIAVGLVDAQGELTRRTEVPKPNDPGEALAAVVGLIDELADGAASIGVGVAGFVNPDRRRVHFSANIGWEDLDLVAALGSHLPVVVENDAAAAAWGEYVAGAGRGADNLVVVTVGTGIGGGLVIDGSLVRGSFGGAAEIGHLRFVPDGLPCGCGQRGCWEQYASGTALLRHAQEAADAQPDQAAEVLRLSGGDRVAGKAITTAALAGDPFARTLLSRLGQTLGVGIASVAAVVDPDTIVIGGGVADAGELLLAPLRHALTEHLTGGARRPHPEILRASLGNDAGIIGAALLSRSTG
jgi:glucokinase